MREIRCWVAAWLAGWAETPRGQTDPGGGDWNAVLGRGLARPGEVWAGPALPLPTHQLESCNLQ